MCWSPITVSDGKVVVLFRSMSTPLKLRAWGGPCGAAGRRRRQGHSGAWRVAIDRAPRPNAQGRLAAATATSSRHRVIQQQGSRTTGALVAPVASHRAAAKPGRFADWRAQSEIPGHCRRYRGRLPAKGGVGKSTTGAQSGAGVARSRLARRFFVWTPISTGRRCRG